MMFSEGSESAEDNPGTGQSKSVFCVNTTQAILDMVDEDRRVSVREVTEHVGISVGSVHSILTKS